MSCPACPAWSRSRRCRRPSTPSWDGQRPLRAAAEHVRDWIAARGLAGAQCEIVELEGRSPLLLVDVPATPAAADRGTVLLYGHLDKQPPVGGWSDGLGPWQPVLRDGRLYGRGAVDDGYSGYAAVTALEAVQAAGGEHARAVLLLETGEESGSPDLPAYLEHLADRLGDVTLVVCLDARRRRLRAAVADRAACAALVQATVTVRSSQAAQHSGIASGIVPSSFRIMRQLLDRLEDSATGEIRLAADERRRSRRSAAPRREAFAAGSPGAGQATMFRSSRACGRPRTTRSS